MEQKDRQYYENLFDNQPDVLDTEAARRLLGGIAYATICKLIRNGHLKHILYQDKSYQIPKVWLIDYILSEHYQHNSKKFKSQI